MIVFLTVFSVLQNLFFAIPFTGLEDLAAILMGTAVAMTIPYGELQKTHLKVDVFSPYIPLTLKKAINVTTKAFVVILSSFLVIMSFLGLLQTKADRLLSNTLGLELWYFYCPLLVSLLLWLTVMLIRLFKRPADD